MRKGNCKACLAILAGGVSIWLTGCATPARPEFDEFGEAPACKALNGEYIATFHTRWFGPLKAKMTAQQTDGGFKANTQPGVAWSLVGGVEKVLGQLLAPFMFPNGMLLVWESSMPDEEDGEPGEGWIGPGVFDPWRAATRMKSVDGPVEIRYRDGRVLAIMTIERSPPVSMPETDYGALTDSLESAMRSRLFDPELGGSGASTAFFRDVHGAVPRVTDDVSYVAALALAWRKRTDLALPIPYRQREAGVSDPLLAAAENQVAPISMTMNDKTGIATVEAVVFQNAAQVDAVMWEVVSKAPRGLIVDLRNCTGLELAGLRMVSWLSDRPVEAGAMIGGARRADLIDDTPAADQAVQARLAAIELGSMGDFELADAELDRQGAARLRVLPVENRYEGPVVVLTSSRTRSTGEMLAWLLEHTGRARTVGERTAGRPRLSRERELGQGFMLRLDEFEWVGPAGERLDVSKGIEPDVKSSRQRAPARAAQLLDEKPAE